MMMMGVYALSLDLDRLNACAIERLLNWNRLDRKRLF